MGSTERAIRSLASAAWLAWVCLASAAQAEPVDAAARALLEAAGMDRQLEEWPELNVVVRDRARGALDPEAFARLSRDVAELFSRAALRDGVAARLPTQAESELVAELQEGFASPRTTVLRAMDRESANVEVLRGLPLFASQFYSRRKPGARLEAIRRIDRAQRFSESVMTVAHSVSQAFVHGLGALACTPAPEVAIHAAQERERLERLERKLRERVWKTLLFAWRGAEAQELVRHAAFLESQPCRWFFPAVEDSLTATLEAATNGLDSRLAPAAADRCGASPAR